MPKTRWTADHIPDQTGRTVLVTGANSGLGYATVKALAGRGAAVILAVRNEDKGRQALDRLRAAQPAVDARLVRVDLVDLDSVRAAAGELLDAGTTVDVIVNNAGVMMPPRALSPQGNELQFAGNHLGHFALTGLLLGALDGPDRRVVTVSSTMHRAGSIHFDDLTGAKRYSATAFYAQSKFANAVFGLELDRRLRAAGRPIKSLLAHPGYSATNLQSTGPSGLLSLAMRIGNPIFAQSADRGALNQLYAASEPSAHSGEFIGPDGFLENSGYPTVVQPTPRAQDLELGRRLWTLSEELTGVSFGLPEAG